MGCVSCAMSGSLVHRLHDFGIARKVLVLETQHVRMRREVAQALEDGQREIGRRHLEGEALADESRELGLVFERVDAGDDAAGAVPEQEDRQPWLASDLARLIRAATSLT